VVVQQIVARTDGIPLYVEEVTRLVLESGSLEERAGQYVLSAPVATVTIPPTLQGALLARLDRLGAAREVAQLGAVIGRQFTYALLQAVSSLDEATLQQYLGQLVAADILTPRGMQPQTTYTFTHALIQEAAYQSLLRRSRQHCHEQLAQALTAQFPDIAATQPELLAHHYTEAALHEHAVPAWQRAGEQAVARSAYVEAISHLTKGLEVLKTLPTTPERTQYELDLQTTLGPALMATKGYVAPEVGHAYVRARELCQKLGDTPQLFPVLRGLWRFYQARGEVRMAHELAAQCFSLAQRTQDPTLLLGAHEALGVSLFQLGEMLPAFTHFDHGVALYDPQQHRSLAFLYGQDSGVACLTRAAVVQWVLGYPDQALQRSHAALAMAREPSHPFSLAYVLSFTVMVRQFLRDRRTVQEWTEALVTLTTEQGFAQQTLWGTMLQGWARAAQGQGEAGIAQIRQGLTAWQAMGAKTGVPYCLTLLAESCGANGQAAEGLRLLAEALAVVHDTEERFHEAEVYRLKGELLLQSGIQPPESEVFTLPHAEEAETCFQQALDVARRQQAKSWELRAAMSLARLWQRQGKAGEAHQILAETYGWFTEGFDTADLQEAKALLEELAADHL
jgi:predicted ATPase